MNEIDVVPIKRALISVSDKTGIVEFARNLREHGVAILSTGGTFRLLEESGVKATEISAYTEFPEMMDGRIKTLHPRVHGGILARRGTDEAVMAEHGIDAIDLVVANLYPFEQAVAEPDCDLEEAVENIDIGGPAMLRAAAKNYRFVCPVIEVPDYFRVLMDMEENGGGTVLATRFDLAVRAYEHTAAYEAAIANHFGRLVEGGSERFPRTYSTQFHRVREMRYGENPHQSAAFYAEQNPAEVGIATAGQLQGKALSYNNMADADAALECVKTFVEPACVIVKHANPCGVAVAETPLDAYDRAFATDPESAFGGIVAFNRELDEATATAVVERQFVEVIVAPSFSQYALAATATKENLRILACGEWGEARPALDYKRINGGLLVQDRDVGTVGIEDLKVVSRTRPDDEQMQDLLFAWKVAKFVKSNAIVYAGGGRTIGIGAGQMSRVNSARVAADKAEHAGLEVRGAVMASDAFFPFRDGIDNAAAVGIAAVIQPGGSVRDEEVIAAADEHGMAMVFTAMRHFRH